MKTGGGFKMKNIAHRTSGLGLLVLLMLGATSASQAQIILDRKVGEIFVAIGGGQYQVWDFSNTPTVETITNGAGSNAGCAFDSMYHPFTTGVTANNVFRDMIDDPQNVLQAISVPANGGAPTSIAFDGAGNFYAGQAGGNGLIAEYSPGPSGTFSFVQTLPVNTKTLKGGSAWMDLSTDGNTIYFTNGTNTISRFAVSSSTIRKFASISNATLYALRVLPSATQTATGGLLLVAAVFSGSSQIYLLDGKGNTVAPSPYSVAGANNLQVLTLDPDGKHFWVGSPTSNNFFEIDFATGTPSVAHNTVNKGAARGPNGLCAYGGFSAAQPQPTAVTATLTPNSSTANTTCTAASGGIFNCTFSTVVPPPTPAEACPFGNTTNNCFGMTLHQITPSSGVQLTYNYSQIAQRAGTSDAGLMCDLTSPDGTKCEVHSVDVSPIGGSSTTYNYDLDIFSVQSTTNPEVLKNEAHNVTDFLIHGSSRAGGSGSGGGSTFTVNEQPIAVAGQASCGWISPLINSQYNNQRVIPFKFQGAVSFSDCPSPSSTQLLTNLVPSLEILQANSAAPGATTNTAPQPVAYTLSNGTQCPAVPGCQMRLDPTSGTYILNVDASSLPGGGTTYFGWAYDTNTPPQIPSFSYTLNSMTQTDFFTVK